MDNFEQSTISRLSALEEKAKHTDNKVDSLLTFLSAMGIIVDPTTQGISDSEQALDYDLPR
ncbi:phage holin [Bacillus halotolerans]|uniref:phage holin n=1 Tax=Bacillus halotolerans TaxID=260554 RepID=UPI002DC3CFE2|nr:phage holin [Bacillus halotolerans]